MNFINPATWPYKISSILGDPRPYGQHEGVDLVPTSGAGDLSVVAAAAGTVIESGYMPDGYGYWVKLQHADGYQTIYGHFASSPLVKKGDTVGQGQKIGTAGSTGYSSGTHLHFSIVKDGTYLDPMTLIGAAASVIGDAMKKLTDFLEQDPFGGKLDECGPLPVVTDTAALEAWTSCAQSKLSIAEVAILDEYLRNLWGESDPSKSGILGSNMFTGSLIDLSPLIDFFEGVVDTATDGITWPIRSYVNALKLADPPLITGKDTIAWLKLPENQRLYIASGVALILAIVFTLLAINSFLGDPGGKAINMTINAAAGAATGGVV